MEVALCTAIAVNAHALLRVGFHLQIRVHDECAFGLDKLRVVAEAFEVGFFCTVNVEVVSIC